MGKLGIKNVTMGKLDIKNVTMGKLGIKNVTIGKLGIKRHKNVGFLLFNSVPFRFKRNGTELTEFLKLTELNGI